MIRSTREAIKALTDLPVETTLIAVDEEENEYVIDIKMKIILNNIDSVKRFVEIALQQEEEIFVSAGRYVVDGKSILGIFSLNLMEPLNININTDNKVIKNEFINKLYERGLIYETEQD